MFRRQLLIFVILIGLFLNSPFAFAGTVLSSYKYAWSNNVGYINFENTIVNDSTLSGYAWSANAGWIKFDPAKGGVLNDRQGHLSGFAWGENLGWINFGGVTVSTTTGKFFGTATGTVVGTINFNCPNYCDVRTDWTPPNGACTSWTYSNWGSCLGGQQTRIVLTSSPSGCSGGSSTLSQSCSSSGSGGGFPSVPGITINPGTGILINEFIQTTNQDLTIGPTQSGKYTEVTDAGNVVLEVPANAVSGKITFYITGESLNSENNSLVLSETQLVNNTFYNVYAKDQDGNFVHSFSSPISVTLPIPKNLIGDEDLHVYWLNETNMQWVLIPDAVFSGNKATFKVSHLTKFAIFNVEINMPAELVKKPEIKTSLQLPKNINYSSSTNKNIGVGTSSKNIIQKIVDIIQPVFSGIFKSGKKVVSTSTQTNISYASSTVVSTTQNNNLLLIFILFILLFILFKRRKKNKDKSCE